MGKNFDKISSEKLIELIVSGAEDINDLDPMKSSQRSVLLAVLEKRPNLLSKIKGENAKNLLIAALSEKSKNAIYLSEEQYTDEVLQVFLYDRLNSNSVKNLNKKTNNALITRRSMDKRNVFVYTYVTADGDELNYFDTELNVPLSLKSSFNITLKLMDSVKFVKKIDLELGQLGENKIKSLIVDIVKNEYNSFLGGYIKNKNVGFYTLSTTLNELEEGFKDHINKAFKEYGLTATELIITKLSIPKDVKNKVEQLAFAIRQTKVDMEMKDELAKKSLENYEAKLAIQQKYPDVEHTLTEFEKDLALNRYLAKMGRLSNEAVDYDNKLNVNSLEVVDEVISKQKDIVPEFVPPTNYFKRAFIIFGVIGFLISIIIASEVGLGTGLIVLGVLIALFGTIASFSVEKFEDKKVEITKEDIGGSEHND